MSSINVFGETPSVTSLTEELLGDAYLTVKKVADNLDLIQALGGDTAAEAKTYRDAAAISAASSNETLGLVTVAVDEGIIAINAARDAGVAVIEAEVVELTSGLNSILSVAESNFNTVLATAEASNASTVEQVEELVASVAQGVNQIDTYAAGVWDLIPTRASVALGLADIPEGEPFLVPMADGGYSMKYIVAGTKARQIGPVPITPAAIANDAKIELAKAAYAPVADNAIVLITRTSNRWGGKLLENVFSTQAPTANAIDSHWVLDGEGNTTPTISVPAVLGPDGTFTGMNLTFNAGSHNLEVFNNIHDNGIPADSVLSYSVFVRSSTSTSSVIFGSASRGANESTTVILSPDWAEISGVIPDYDSDSPWDIGLIPENGTTVPIDMDAAMWFVSVDSGPIATPSFSELRNDLLAGHSRSVLGRFGAMQVDEDGWVMGTATFTNAVMPLARKTISNFTMSIWMDIKESDQAGSFLAGMSFNQTPGAGTSTNFNEGAVGVDLVDNSFYFAPNYNNTESGIVGKAVNQKVHAAVTVKDIGDGTVLVTNYVNGVPLLRNTEVFSPIEIGQIMLFANGLEKGRQQDNQGEMQIGDRMGDPVFSWNALTDDQISDLYLAGRKNLNVPEPSVFVAGCGDSLTAFGPSPFWALAELQPDLPSVLFGLEAQGGTSFVGPTGYVSEPRRTDRQLMMKYAAKHYASCVVLAIVGTNDIGGSSRAMSDLGVWEAGKTDIDNMFQEDKLSVPETDRHKVKLVLATIPPRADFLNAVAPAINAERQQVWELYNADCRENYLTRGYEYLIDFEASPPPGFPTLIDAALDASANNGNDIFGPDGLHWDKSMIGSLWAASTFYVPAINWAKEQITTGV